MKCLDGNFAHKYLGSAQTKTPQFLTSTNARTSPKSSPTKNTALDDLRKASAELAVSSRGWILYFSCLWIISKFYLSIVRLAILLLEEPR
jgi:hypothetical protein